MKRRFNIILLSLLAIILAVTLIACDKDTGTQYTPPTNVGGGGEPTETDLSGGKPAYLSFTYKSQTSSVFSKIYVDEFKPEDVIVHVVYEFSQQSSGGKVSYEYKADSGRALTLEMLTSESRELIGIPGDHMIFANYTVDDKVLSGSFALHLKSRSELSFTTVKFRLDGGSSGFGTTVGGIVSADAALGARYSWSEFIAAFPIYRQGYALSAWVSGGTTYNSSSDSITIAENMEFTPVWTQNLINVKFELNLPADAAYDSQPAVPPAQNVEKNNGVVARPDTASYDSVKNYTFGGWFDQNGSIWNFNRKAGGNNITLTARWIARTYSVTFNLLGGEFRPNMADAPAAPKLAGAEVSYQLDSADPDANKPFKVIFTGITYGAKLKDYNARIKPKKDSTAAVLVNAASMTDANLMKGDEYYSISGWYSDPTFQTPFDYNTETLIEENLTLFAKWTLSTSLTVEKQNSYFADYLFEWTPKSDGTARIDKVRDNGVNTLIIPRAITSGDVEYPISEIGIEASMNLKSLITVDASQAVRLTNIRDKAFAYCPSLRSVLLPENCAVSSVGRDAFRGTEWLNEYSVLNNGARYLNIGSVLVKYLGRNDAEEIIIDEIAGVKTVAAGAFASMPLLKKITLSKNIEGLQDYSFENCTQLSEIILPAESALTFVGANAFKGTAFINGVATDKTELVIGNIYYRYIGPSSTTSATIPDGVTIIAPGAFAGARNISRIDFENGVDSRLTQIGAGAFADTSWVLQKNIAYDNPATYVRDGFTVIGGILANYTGQDKIVTLPADVRMIASGAFQSFHNEDVTNIMIPADSKLADISNRAFYGAYNLAAISFLNAGDNVDMPASAVQIHFQTFQGPTNDFINSGLIVYFYDNAKAAIMGGTPEWEAMGRLGRLAKLETKTVEIEKSVVGASFLDEGTGVDFTAAWRSAGVLDETGDTPILIGALKVTRSDGNTTYENVALTQTVLDALDKTVGSEYIYADKTMTLKFNEIASAEYSYRIYAGVDESTIEIHGYPINETTGELTFYTSQINFPINKGSLEFKYTNNLPGSVELYVEKSIKISGYNPAVGTRTLSIEFNFHDLKTYSINRAYTVTKPVFEKIEQYDHLTLPLNATANEYLRDVRMLVTKSDGSTTLVPLVNARITISSVDGKDSDVITTEGLGYHTAVVTYGNLESGYVQGTFVYSVVLSTDPADFRIQKLTAPAGVGEKGTAAIVGISSDHLGTVAIPSEISQGGVSYVITEIADNAFKNNLKLQTIYIPESVRKIGDYAFAGCTNLNAVYSFANQASNVTEFGLNHVAVIRETRQTEATVKLTGLASISAEDTIVVPSHIELNDTFIENGNGYLNCTVDVTYNCKVLLDPAVEVFDNFTGRVFLPDTADFDAYANAHKDAPYKIIRYAVGTMPATGSRMFTHDAPVSGNSVKRGEVTVINNSPIIVNGGVVVIPPYLSGTLEGDSYYYDVTTVEEGGLRYIAENGCTRLFVPTSLKNLRGNADPAADLTVIDGLYGGKENHKKVTAIVYEVPVNLENYTLSDVMAPRESFSGGVEIIGNHAFRDCTSLTSAGLDFSTALSLRKVGVYAFGNCSSLIGIDLGKTQLTEINANTFMQCLGLTTVVLPSTLTQIGNSAFLACMKLSSVSKVDAAGLPTEKIGGITFIGPRAFYICAFDPAKVFTDYADPVIVDPTAFDGCREQTA